MSSTKRKATIHVAACAVIFAVGCGAPADGASEAAEAAAEPGSSAQHGLVKIKTEMPETVFRTFTTSQFTPGPVFHQGNANGNQLFAQANGGGGNSSAQLSGRPEGVLPLYSSTVYAFADFSVLWSDTTSNGAVEVELQVLDERSSVQCDKTLTIAGNGGPATPPSFIQCDQPFVQYTKSSPYTFNITLRALATNFWDHAGAMIVVNDANIKASYNMNVINLDTPSPQPCLQSDPSVMVNGQVGADTSTCTFAPNQLWQYEPQEDHSLRTIDGQCLTVQGPITNSAPVVIAPCEHNANQRWGTFGPFTSSTPTVFTMPSGLCLTSLTGANGQDLVLGTCLVVAPPAQQVWLP